MANTKLMKPGTWYSEYDENGNCLKIIYEASFRKLLGYKNEEEYANTQESWEAAVHPDDKDRVFKHYYDVLDKHPKGKSFDIEYRLMTVSGYHWFHDYAKDIRRKDGSIVRLEGVIFDVEESYEKIEIIEHETLRRQVANYMVAHPDVDPIELLKTFANKIRILINCDQVIYRDLEETRIMVNSPAIEKTWSVPFEYCKKCAHLDAHHPMYAGGFTEMENCQEGWNGIPVYKKCPIKSSLTRIVYCDGEIAGYLAIHYVQNYHKFTDVERTTLEEFSRIISMSLSRFKARTENMELKTVAQMQERLKKQQKELQSALDIADNEAQRNDLLMEMFNASKWTYSISPDDEILSASYADKTVRFADVYQPDNPMQWVDVLHPEDKERTLESFMDAIYDHSGKTIYDATFRSMGRKGKYRWVKSAGRVIRHADGSGDFIGMVLDITDQMEAQQKLILGAVPLSPDILVKANIGLWAFELDEGQPPRMYVDDTMLGLLGLDHQVEPNETYHAWYDHIDEGSYDLVTDAVDKMSSGEHAEVQYPWHHPDGHTIIVRCGGVRNRAYKNGIRIEGTHQDVTQTLHYDEEERKRAKLLENELVKSKLRADSLAYIADNDPDLDTAINFFGKKILDISGADQVIFRNLAGHRIVVNAPGIKDIPQDICSNCPFSKFDTNVYKDGYVIMNDCRKKHNGAKAHPDCPAKSSFMQQVYLQGKLVGLLTVHYLTDYHTFTETGIDIMKTIATYCGLLLDRIESKQTREEKLLAEASNKAKTEFLFNMSHDIRTPMNAIIGFTDKAIRHKNNELILEESLDKIKTSGNYLLRLVNDILEMAKIEAGKLEIRKELHFADDGSNAMLEVFDAEAAKKGITLHKKYQTKDKYLWIDETRISQVLANLISNAIKYTDPGGDIWFTVEQFPSEKKGYCKYVATVKDTGRGMSPEFVAKIFNPFEREQTSTNSGEQGTGLGMSIVKRIVDAMGGQIEIDSKPGKGTTVRFTTENRIATPKEIAAFNKKAAEEFEERTHLLKGRRVLLVEDNELNREIAVDILEDHNLLTEEAENGQAAVNKLKEKGPDYYDFVLMDIQMPVMNGYEATKAIREMFPKKKIPIIALSANAFSEDRDASLKAGMDEHVAKPIDITNLFTVMSKFV